MNFIKIEKKYTDNVNCNLNIILMTNPSYFLLTILLKNYGKKSKLVDSIAISQEVRSTTVIA